MDMELLFGLDGLRKVPAGAVLSIGNFDGVHRGHQFIVQTMHRHGGPLAAVTFEPHPLTVLRPHLAPPRLTSATAKRRLLADMGVEYLVELAPEPAVLNLAAEEFWRLLVDEVRPSCLVEGQSFNFGKGRRGTAEQLRQWSVGTSITVHIPPPAEVALLTMQRVTVSSSLIRWLLANGRVRDAAICLGRPYELHGPVVRGFERGRTIGMPTANLACDDQVIPADGVYVAQCRVNDIAYPVALSIGTMPTFGGRQRQIEAHLIGYDGDLYGQSLAVGLIDWIRPQRKFASVPPLLHQLRRDIAWAMERAGLDPSEPLARMDG
jgi:riboflavin kinase / FMN adenylyltransferase